MGHLDSPAKQVADEALKHHTRSQRLRNIRSSSNLPPIPERSDAPAASETSGTKRPGEGDGGEQETKRIAVEVPEELGTSQPAYIPKAEGGPKEAMFMLEEISPQVYGLKQETTTIHQVKEHLNSWLTYLKCSKLNTKLYHLVTIPTTKSKCAIKIGTSAISVHRPTW